MIMDYGTQLNDVDQSIRHIIIFFFHFQSWIEMKQKCIQADGVNIKRCSFGISRRWCWDLRWKHTAYHEFCGCWSVRSIWVRFVDGHMLPSTEVRNQNTLMKFWIYGWILSDFWNNWIFRTSQKYAISWPMQLRRSRMRTTLFVSRWAARARKTIQRRWQNLTADFMISFGIFQYSYFQYDRWTTPAIGNKFDTWVSAGRDFYTYTNSMHLLHRKLIEFYDELPDGMQILQTSLDIILSFPMLCTATEFQCAWSSIGWSN